MSKTPDLRARASRAQSRPERAVPEQGGPEEAPAPARSAAARPAPRTKPYRITLDLAPVLYQDLNRWCGDTGTALGMRVTNAAVLRALVRELDGDPELSERVRARLTAEEA